MTKDEERSMLPDVIETERLRLRPFHFGDLDDVMAYASDPEWARYLFFIPQPYTRVDGEKFIAAQVLQDRSEHPAWAIEHAGTVLGGVNLRFHFDHRLAEMGYSIARSHWGRGFATEAAGAVVDTAFTSLSSLERIRAMADARNAGSLRVMEKVGMVREGVLRRNRLMRGELLDEVWCGLLRPEWEARRQETS